MTRSQKELLGVAALALAGAGMIWIGTLMPKDCKPNNRLNERLAFNLVIGGTMLMAGCPEPGGHR